ncbi:MAG: glutathione S-transferase family protein [Agarilytica sp.]
MGMLVKGEWHNQWYDTSASGGEFKREAAQLRHWITTDGDAGPSGESGFKAESGRYHLYVSLACPWAHRTLIFRRLKKLEQHISVSIVSPDMLDKGWSFTKNPNDEQDEACTGDPLHHYDFMYQVYTANKADYSGRVTVPVLWDKKQNRIVSNESSEIIRMFNSAFNKITKNTDDYYPKPLHDIIDQINSRVYDNINNGVYRCGFATSQKAYEKAYLNLFNELDNIESALDKTRYLCGSQVSEADWRLFTTLIRFDSVYYGHFKCNKKRIEDYPNISNYIRELYQWPGISETVNFHHIKRHYYYSHDKINPTRIVPVGPKLDYMSKHNRAEKQGF